MSLPSSCFIVFFGPLFLFLAVKIFSGNSFSSLLLITMPSLSDNSSSTPVALLPIDDRLVAVSKSAEPSSRVSVSEQEVEPESRSIGSSEDEATQYMNLLLDRELGT